MFLFGYSIFLFYFLFSCCSFEELDIYLTKDKNKVWYKNFTRRSSPTNPYCSICCIDTTKSNLSKICGKHTMCIYPPNQYGPGCNGVLDIPFLPEEIDAIVDAHNTIRNKVAMGLESSGNPGPQPHASNMREIEWNEDLATVAHRWASQCTFAHDTCRDLDRYPVGQNIAKGNFATNDDLSFIAAWFNQVHWINQVDLVQYQILSNDPLRQYTQLVWAETYLIGCARVSFEHYNGARTTYTIHFFCNYGPTGNIPGQNVYKIGEPCTVCPSGTGCSSEYPGLCGKNHITKHTDSEFKMNYDVKLPSTKVRSNIMWEFRNYGENIVLSSLLFYFFLPCLLAIS